jgi:hypothetical protein
MSSAKDLRIEKDGDMVSSSAAAEAGATASASVDRGVESSSDESLDDSYQVFKATEDLHVEPAEAKRVLRKIDLRVVPVLFFTYMLQYLDKSEFQGQVGETYLHNFLSPGCHADVLGFPIRFLELRQCVWPQAGDESARAGLLMARSVSLTRLPIHCCVY